MLTAQGLGSASWIEIIWTLAATPGLILWFNSWLSARQSLNVVKALKNTNGRLLWAKFSSRLTGLMAFIELTFMTIGVISLSREPNPAASLISTLIIAGGLTGASVLITFLAYQWRAVEEQILTLARARLVAKEKLADVKTAQDSREIAQNTRDTDQNLRSFKQDEREKDQNG